MGFRFKPPLATLVLAAMLLGAQSTDLHPLDLDIDGPDGGFHLTGNLCSAVSVITHKREPRLVGAIIGRETSWSNVHIRITLRAGTVEKDVMTCGTRHVRLRLNWR